MAQGRQRGVAFAKTTRPVIGSAVRREALFARLDSSGRAVAWISGPPGCGKSTLAASYVEARNYACIWYQLDADDADVATFFHYLRHAARRLDDGGTRDLPAYSAQYAGDVGSFARNFFRQLFMRARGPAALVLDNLHEVSANSPLHAALEAGLSQVPARCCVVIASRAEPPASLARMRLSGRMVHLGWEDLRISAQEIADIAALRGQALSQESVAKLHERTQGWAAGLVLMLEHAKIAGRIADLPPDATPKVIFDYLAGEIFDRIEPRTQQFLLGISCLPRMSAEVAAELTGEQRAARLLLNLAQNDYFVREVPGDGERLYQLHPLLRDFLRDRAARVLPEASAPAGLRRAAELLRGTGHVEDAVSLLAECADWDTIARIAAEEADDMLAQGRSETLCAWLALLPARLLESDPRLLLAHAASRLHASPRPALRLYAQAYEGFRSARNARGMAQSACGAVSAIVQEFDDLTALDPWIAALTEWLDTNGDSDEEYAARSAATLTRALLLRDPGSPRLVRWLERSGRRNATGFAAPQVSAELALGRAMAALFRGDIGAAIALIGSLPTEGETPADMSIAASIAGSMCRLAEGSATEAMQVARRALEMAQAEGVHACDTWLRTLVAAAALSAGDLDGARAELQSLEGAGVRLRRGDQAFVHYLRGWLAVLEDDAAGASRETRVAVAVAEELGIPWLECLARIRWVQGLSAEGDQRGADGQARSALALARAAGSPLLTMPAQLATAAMALKHGDEHGALVPLAAGLAAGREHGLRHVMALRPSLLAELCALALRAGVEPEFARSVARAGNLAPPPAAVRAKQWPRPFQVCTLGGFALLRDAAPVEFTGKGPGRPVELLKVLVALGGQNVRSDQIADALWPRVDADYAHKSFTATLHRLRRILDEDDAVLLRDTRLSLNPRLCWVDTWALDHVIAEIDGLLRDPHLRPPEALRKLADEALALYRGPFLPDESEQPSYIAFREQLRARLLRSLSRAARRWEDSDMGEAAVDCYLRCIDADELCEGYYRNLMLCHQRRGEHNEALTTFERLRTVLATRLKAAPSAETQAVYASLVAPPDSRPAARE